MPVLQLIQFFGETAAHGAEEATGIAALGIDPWAILAQAGTFLILLWVIKRFALEKIVNTLEERRQTIDKGVRLGYEMAEEKTKLEEKIEAQLRETRDKADQIIAEAHKEAGIILKDAEASAGTKVDTMLADAQARIAEDMKKARKDLEKDILGFVADATEAIIGEKLDAKKDDNLIKRILNGAKN